MLKLLHLTEIEREHKAAGRVGPAEASSHDLVDEPVILGGAFPAHAADQADCLQVAYPSGIAPKPTLNFDFLVGA
jgi:hypothetical protein